MIRQIVCVFCVLLLLPSFSASAEPISEEDSLDFDLVFSLNADAFPPVLRERMQGYADLLNRIGLRGNIAWSVQNNSMDLNATLYFLDKPSVSFPFRLYGAAPRLFFASPMIQDEIIFLNMAGFLEFGVKAKNTLNLNLPYVALLYPFSTEYAFSALTKSWNEIIGSFPEKGGTVSAEQFQQLAELWNAELQDNQYLQIWISALAEGSDAPEAIYDEFSSLPSYYQAVTGGQSVSVTVDESSETWKNAAGDVLFSRVSQGNDFSVFFTLPASKNRYVPAFSFSTSRDERSLSFDLAASVLRDESAPASLPEQEESEDSDENVYAPVSDNDYEEDEEYGDYEEDEEYDGYEYEDEDYGEEDEEGEVDDGIKRPDTLLKCGIAGRQLPVSLPSDSSFSIVVSMEGAAYPNYSFVLKGQTGQDGSLSLSVCKPGSAEEASDVIFSCSGTLVSGGNKEVPNYMRHPYKELYNVFSFNEERLADFKSKVIPPLVKSVFAFVAEAPTSACQSFLDDLTDMGVLHMLLN